MSAAGSDPEWLRRIEHTADEAIAVTASTLADLFARAAWAMFSILTDPASVRDVERTKVAAEATDLDALLVHWLSELNFIHQTQRKLFCRFEVKEIDDRHVCGFAWGEARDPARHPVYTEIKAVTFHALKVERVADGWEATVLFDV